MNLGIIRRTTKIRKPDILDVAKWFLSKKPMTPKRLQILCYYAQAWSVTLNKKDIAEDCEFVARPQCPINTKLYDIISREGLVSFDRIRLKSSCKPPNFKYKDIDLLKRVWATYEDLSDNALAMLVTSEHPWTKARWGKEPFEPCEKTISRYDMREYYGFIKDEQ